MSSQSPTIAALAAALSKAQGQIRGAKKDSANPFFKSKYADLSEVWSACREALTANGIAVIQSPDGDTPETMVLITTIAHASGEWMSGRYPIRAIKADPQGIGSAITYARRYALAAMIGIASEDDDGEAATGRQAPNVPAKAQQPAKSPTKAIAEPAKMSIQDECKEWGARLKSDAGAPFTNDVWKHSGETWELRLGTLKDICLATIGIQDAVGQEQGREDIARCIQNHTMDPTGLQLIRKELVRMANGEVTK